LKVPCITLRPETEWVETVNAGWNIVIGNDAEGLLNTARYFNPRVLHRRSSALQRSGEDGGADWNAVGKLMDERH